MADDYSKAVDVLARKHIALAANVSATIYPDRTLPKEARQAVRERIAELAAKQEPDTQSYDRAYDRLRHGVTT